MPTSSVSPVIEESCIRTREISLISRMRFRFHDDYDAWTRNDRKLECHDRLLRRNPSLSNGIPPTNEGFGLRRMLEACYHRGSQTIPAQSWGNQPCSIRQPYRDSVLQALKGRFRWKTSCISFGMKPATWQTMFPCGLGRRKLSSVKVQVREARDDGYR